MVSGNGQEDADVDPLPPRYTAPRATKRPATPRQRNAPPTDALLVKKFVDLDEYKSDLRAGKSDDLVRTDDALGTTPIIVPLARGESMGQYEARFEDWLRRERAMTLRELESEKLRPLERRLRVRFAELNVNGTERFNAPESPRSDTSKKRERRSPGRSRSRERSAKRPAPEDRPRAIAKPSNSSESTRKEIMHATKSTSSERGTPTQKQGVEARARQTDSGRHSAPRDRSEDVATLKTQPAEYSERQNESRDRRDNVATKKAQPARDSEKEAEGDCRRRRSNETESLVCHAKLPASATAPLAEIVAAYVACACQTCLIEAVSRMATRVSELEKRVDEGCGCKAHQRSPRSAGQHVADITRDDDRQSPSEPSDSGPNTEPNADAITRLILSRPSTEQLTTPSTLSRAKKRIEMEDPIERKLAEAYDLVNQRIGRNEKTFDVSSARLTSSTTSVADVAELAELHDEKDELAAIIERDSEKRTAALAALAVYLWRDERSDLEKMVNDAAASNVPHVQTAGHRKCATLATEIATKREHAAKIRRQLDAAIHHDDNSSSSENQRLVVLQKLGELLATAERELHELLAQRRRALATVVHFDVRARKAIQAQLLTPK